MHFKSLLHVRDHSKVRGTAHHLLEFIAQHTNMHTGEAFELTVERLAYRLDVTPQWVRRLRAGLVASGELEVQQSRGRRPNLYRIPYERCPLCQAANPKLEARVHETNPKLDPPQPETASPPTRNSAAPSEVGNRLYFPGVEPETPPQKEVERKERTTHGDQPETDDPPPRCAGRPSREEQLRYCDYHRRTHFYER